MGLLNDSYLYKLAEDIWKTHEDDVDPVLKSKIAMADVIEKELCEILGEDYSLDGNGICSDIAYEIMQQYNDFQERYEQSEPSARQEAWWDVINETIHSL